MFFFFSSQFSSKPTNPQWIQKRMWWNNFYFPRFVMIQLFFAAKWILVSEVTFESGEIFRTPPHLEISFQCGDKFGWFWSLLEIWPHLNQVNFGTPSHLRYLCLWKFIVLHLFPNVEINFLKVFVLVLVLFPLGVFATCLNGKIICMMWNEKRTMRNVCFALTLEQQQQRYELDKRPCCHRHPPVHLPPSKLCPAQKVQITLG